MLIEICVPTNMSTFCWLRDVRQGFIAQLLMQTYMWFRCAGFCKSEKLVVWPRSRAAFRVYDAMRESFVFRRTLFV